jgi:hypothetical protein
LLLNLLLKKKGGLESDKKMEEEMARNDRLAENNSLALRSAGARERRLRLRITALSERGKLIKHTL